MTEVKEQFSEGKNPSRPSEDRIVATDHFCAVIDGSTSKAAAPASGAHTTGWLAAETLARCVRSLPRESTMEEAGAMFTAAIARYYEEHGLAQAVRLHAERRLTASMVLYSSCRNEVWMFGDCQFRFAGHTYVHPKRVDDILAAIRADILHYLIRKGHTVEALRADDMGRKFIYGALRDQCGFQNVPASNPYSYSVVDGFALPAVERRSVNDAEPVGHTSVRAFRSRGPVLIELPPTVKPARRTPETPARPLLILASDGYPLLGDTLAETEHLLASILQKDPLMTDIVPSTKGLAPGAVSFDDRSYLSFFV